MTFTKTPPTAPGFFLWKAEGRDSMRVVDVWLGGNKLLADVSGAFRSPVIVSEMGGEWCRFVPAEEIEKGFCEGWIRGVSGTHPAPSASWRAANDT